MFTFLRFWSRSGITETETPPFAPERWRPVIWAITNVFESGRAEGNAAALQTQDAGILSYGPHQATLLAGTLEQVLTLYIQTSHTAISQALTPWLPQIRAKDPALRQAVALHQLLITAAADPAMQAAQDVVFARWYYQPAIEQAIALHLRTPLALACLYDAGVQGGRDHILARLGSQVPLDEARWIGQFLTEREKWLVEAANSAAAKG